MKSPKLLSALAALLVTSLAAAHAAPKPGDTAPDFSLPDPDGKTHSLADYKGKHVVLEWVNHGCPFVKKHYASGNMQGLQKRYTEKGVVWLTICSSAPGKQGHMTPGEAKKSLAEHNAAPTALLLDPEGKVSRLYGVSVTPELFIINPEGTLVYAGAIDDKPSTKQEDIAGAKNFVAAALDELLAGKAVSTPVTKPYGCSIKH